MRNRYIPQPSRPNPQILMSMILAFSMPWRKEWTIWRRVGNEKSLSSQYENIHEVYDEYPSDTISTIFDHLYANYYNACLQSDGDNKYKSPHENVRQRFAAGESLNTCCLSFEEYTHRKAQLEEWFAIHEARG
jgi:hypothetical protein